MDTVYFTLLTALAACVVTLAVVMFLSPLARRIGLVDSPGERKKHLGDIPLVGGLSIFFVVCGFSLYSGNVSNMWEWVLSAAALLVFTGTLDDFFDIRPVYRLLAQIFAAGLVIYGTGLHIHTLAHLSDGAAIEAGMAANVITLIAVVGLVNAFNMVDGIDGLAAMHALLAISLVQITFMLLGRGGAAGDVMIAALFGAVLGFLCVNLGLFSRRKAFLGDAGSMFIGFVIAWMLIAATQKTDAEGLPPSFALWPVALPVMDTVVLSVRRLALRRSPFSPDRKHLHHVFFRLGLSPGRSLALICLMSVAVYCVGFAAYLVGEDVLSIIVFVLMMVGYYFVIKRIWRISSYLRKL